MSSHVGPGEARPPNTFRCFQSEKDIIFDNVLFPSCGSCINYQPLLWSRSLLRTSPLQASVLNFPVTVQKGALETVTSSEPVDAMH